MNTYLIYLRDGKKESVHAEEMIVTRNDGLQFRQGKRVVKAYAPGTWDYVEEQD